MEEVDIEEYSRKPEGTRELCIGHEELSTRASSELAERINRPCGREPWLKRGFHARIVCGCMVVSKFFSLSSLE